MVSVFYVNSRLYATVLKFWRKVWIEIIPFLWLKILISLHFVNTMNDNSSKKTLKLGKIFSVSKGNPFTWSNACSRNRYTHNEFSSFWFVFRRQRTEFFFSKKIVKWKQVNKTYGELQVMAPKYVELYLGLYVGF